MKQLIIYDNHGINTDSQQFNDFCELAGLKDDANKTAFFDKLFEHLTEIFVLSEDTPVNKNLFALFTFADKSILNSFFILTDSKSLNLFYSFCKLRIVGNYSDNFHCPYCFVEMDNRICVNETPEREEWDVKCEICGFDNVEAFEK